MHWRGIVLTNFDGRRWLTSTRDQTLIEQDAGGEYLFGDLSIPPGDDFSARRFSPRRLLYFALHGVDGADRDGRDLHRSAAPDRCAEDSEKASLPASPSHPTITSFSTGPARSSIRSTTISRLRYDGFSRFPAVPARELRKAPAHFPARILQTYLADCRSSIRASTALAHKITAGSKNEYDKAASIERYLMTHYSYTLDLSGPRAKDPLANFLFVRRSGHCEYFASAMTIMLALDRHSRALRHRLSARRIQRRRRRLHHSRERRARLGRSLLSGVRLDDVRSHAARE